MQDLKISAVVKRDPWSNDYGKFQTYAIQFEGSDQWVQWNKKFKGDEEPTPPKHGDEVFGEVVNGKFKIGKKDGGFTPSASKASSTSFKGEAKKEWIPTDTDAIKAQFAIKAAVQIMTSRPQVTKEETVKEVEYYAKELYQMVDRVKGSVDVKAASGYEQAKQVATAIKGDIPENADVIVEEFDDEPIDMSQIPF